MAKIKSGYIENKLDEFEIEELRKLEGKRPNWLDYAHGIYETLKSSCKDMSAMEFLEYFNEITEDEACIIPRNYPLSVKEFQIKFMRETKLISSLVNNFEESNRRALWRDYDYEKWEEFYERVDNTTEEIDQYELNLEGVN